MKIRIAVVCLMIAVICSACTSTPQINMTKIDDEVRAAQIKDMKFGMFICWSFSTFYEKEWTPTLDKDASFFKATGCDTDQWCKTAKEAGMSYILFLTKHHDGFCLWDTATTDKKVTNSPLGIDVLAKLRKSCDKYGIKLALYFSEGDWNWPGAADGKHYKQGAGINPEMKKAQLKELLTQYGPIEFWWMDRAVGTGGLSHEATVEWVHQFQPNTFVGFNHGAPAGRICLREMGRPGKIGDKKANNKKNERRYKGYHVAEFTYPILPPHEGGASWFYSLPKHDNLCKSAESIYKDYVGALKYGNIFSLDVGPNYEGKLRDIDVQTLREVGEMIRANKTIESPIEDNFSRWSFYSEDPGSKQQDTWKIEKDVLKCTGNPQGYLYTNDSYGDFTMTLDWRWPKGTEEGKGGILFDMTGENKIWPKSLEAQINAGGAGDFWALDGYKVTSKNETNSLSHPQFGELINVIKTKAAEKPAGQWNSYKIIAKGSDVTLIMNGQVVNKAKRTNIKKGKICVTSEGTPIEYRNINIVSN